MSNLTFSTFLRIVEDANGDVAKLQAEMAKLDAQMGPMMARKAALMQQLVIKQKQAVSQGQQGQQPVPQAPMTTTPGGTGAATPGNGQPGM